MPTIDELDALNEAEQEALPVAAAPTVEPVPGPDLAALDALNEGVREEATDTVNVRGADGSFQTVTRADLPQATAAGFELADESDYDRELARQYNESGIGIAQTAAEQVLEGATLGGFGAVAGAVDEGYGQRIDQRAEDNPVTATTAQIAGALAPIALSGGTGGVATAARMAPSALVERAGEAAAAYAAKRMGASLAARTAARGIAGAVEGGLSAAALTAAEELPEIASDPDKWGERLAAVGWSALQGTAIGAGAGLILGGVTESLSDAAAKLGTRAAKRAEKVALRQADEANPVTPDNYIEIAASLEARPILSREVVEQAAARDAATSAFERQVRQIKAAQGSFDDGIQDGTRSIESELNGLLKNLDSVDERADILAKRNSAAVQRANMVADHPLTPQAIHKVAPQPKLELDQATGATRYVDQPAELAEEYAAGPAQELLDSITNSLRFLKSRNGAGDAALQGGGGSTAIARVIKQAEHTKNKVSSLLSQGKYGDAFMELDDMKRVLGQASGTRNTIAQATLREQYESFRQFMEAPEVWGELAEIQRVVNAPWTDRISRQRDQRVRSFFIESGEKAEDPFEALTQANGTKLQSFLGNLGNAGNEGEEQAFRLMIRSMAKDATTRAQAWGTDELRDRAVQITAAVRKIEDELDRVAVLGREAEAGKRLLARNSSSDLMAAGASFVHPALGWMASGTGKIKLQVQRALAEKSGGIDATVDAAVSRFLKTAATGARGVSKASAAADQAAPISGSIINAKRFAAALDEARALTDPTSEQYANLNDDAAVMDDISPGLGGAYVAKTMQRAEYIAAMLPKQAPGLYAPEPRLDPMKERSLKRSVAAAYYPEKALDRLAGGTATAEDLRALKTLFPRLYQDFVERTEQALAARKRVPTREEQQRIHAMTGIVVRPSLAPDAIAQQQAAVSSVAEKDPGARDREGAAKAVKMSRDANSVYASRADKIMAGE